VSVKAFIFALNSLWRYIDNMIELSDCVGAAEFNGESLALVSPLKSNLNLSIKKRAESSNVFCTKLIQEFPLLIVNRRNFIND